jgi:prephenate dehydrogenase
MFGQITILAPGLLGASLGAAVFQRKIAREIVVWARREETRNICREMDWCTRAEDSVAAAAEGAELVVVCAPVSAIPDLVEDCLPVLHADALVTDVGSTKMAICREIGRRFPQETRFVGSHPMAGSEKSGLEYADAELFVGRCCLVTRANTSDPIGKKEQRIVRFWESVGMNVSIVSPDEHDTIVAQISHLPHALASILAAQLSQKPEAWKSFCGSGLRDTTRIAAGNPDMWMDIFEQNRESVVAALTEFRWELDDFIQKLESARDGELRDTLERGKAFRQQLDSNDNVN